MTFLFPKEVGIIHPKSEKKCRFCGKIIIYSSKSQLTERTFYLSQSLYVRTYIGLNTKAERRHYQRHYQLFIHIVLL